MVESLLENRFNPKDEICRFGEQRASLSYFNPPKFENEPIKAHAKGSPERAELVAAIQRLKSKAPVKIPISAGGTIINNNVTLQQENPSNHRQIIANYAAASAKDVNKCIDNALAAKASWETMPFEDRAAIFMRAANLISGKYRADMNAATMLGQGKNIFQAEIDCIAETVDFIKCYVAKAFELFAQQPSIQSEGVWNKLVYRPLEGFVYGVTPFNFTALAGTIVFPPLLLGNVVVWKPSDYALHSSWLLYQILLEAGLPPDVLQFVPGNPVQVTDAVLARPEFAGLSYIGSTAVLQQLIGKIGTGTAEGRYNSYPRISGETGGKNFHLVHSSANVRSAALNTIRATFEYSGQKCSACSRVYVSESAWPEFQSVILSETAKLKTGTVEKWDNFVNPVIHRRSYEKLAMLIESAKSDPELKLLSGGTCDSSEGYFVSPTIYLTTNPNHKFMTDELFGPILTIYVYPDSDFPSSSSTPKPTDGPDILSLIDSTSSYALAGSIFAKDQHASRLAQDRLRHSCGMMYINTKCTGSVVGQQPFGGARMSGTNDKTGMVGVLAKWASVQTVKEEFGDFMGAGEGGGVGYPSNDV